MQEITTSSMRAQLQYSPTTSCSYVQALPYQMKCHFRQTTNKTVTQCGTCQCTSKRLLAILYDVDKPMPSKDHLGQCSSQENMLHSSD